MRNPTIKLALVTGLRASQNAFAGPHADALSRCFVDSTTREDNPSPEGALATSGLARHVDGKKLKSLAGRAR